MTYDFPWYDATWRDILVEEMYKCGDKWEDIVVSTLRESELDVEFDSCSCYEDGDGVGSIKFMVWTKNRVYFHVYPTDRGHVGVNSVPRDPEIISLKESGIMSRRMRAEIWRDFIKTNLEKDGLSIEDILETTLSEEQLNFDVGKNVKPFSVLTAERVYFFRDNEKNENQQQA